MTNLRAIRVYRHLLKAQRKCFKDDQMMINGIFTFWVDDLKYYTASRNKTRSEFELFRLETNPEVIHKSLAYGLEVARVLEQNVAQAIIEKNNIMKLQIRDTTEVNDNDIIRKGKTNNKQVSGVQ